MPVVLAIVVGVGLVLQSGETDQVAPSAATVTRVVDGDTIVVRLGTGREERVRYIGIDTPEVGDPCAQAATDANARMVEGERIRLVRDVSERDRYGRLLAYVYRARDDLFVNEELVRQGHAEAKRYAPDTRFAQQLERAASRAPDPC